MLRVIVRTGPKPSQPLCDPCWKRTVWLTTATAATQFWPCRPLQRTQVRPNRGPSAARPPAPLGSFDPKPDNPLAGFAESARYAVFTPICNATGQPAMSVPLFWNSEGLPVGAHFIGRFGEEDTLFRLAGQLEKARPWKDRRPPVCA